MSEVRIDPLTGLRTIVLRRGSSGGPRADRAPTQLAVSQPQPIDPAGDPFAAGNEAAAGPELQAVGREGGAPDTPGWSVRVVASPRPLLIADPQDPPPQDDPELFSALAPRGAHELIVNAPAPVQSLAELPLEQVLAAVEVWRERMRVHDGAAYVHLGVDERAEAGAAHPHTHAGLHALGFVPAAIARERERFSAYAVRTMGSDLLEDLVAAEVRRRERIVAIDDEAVLLCPYASRHPFALMLVPRRRRARFEDGGATGAALLHRGLSLLRERCKASPPLNLWVRTAPRGAERFCWHIDIVPRLMPAAGLELATGMPVNPVSPEQAAAELRELLA